MPNLDPFVSLLFLFPEGG